TSITKRRQAAALQNAERRRDGSPLPSPRRRSSRNERSPHSSRKVVPLLSRNIQSAKVHLINIAETVASSAKPAEEIFIVHLFVRWSTTTRTRKEEVLAVRRDHR